MKRYAVIVTEKVERDSGPIHWLLKGTVVEVLDNGEVECVSPCYGVDVAQFQKRKHRQFLNDEDIVEFSVEGIV
jgi:hypothetical protein